MTDNDRIGEALGRRLRARADDPDLRSRQRLTAARQEALAQLNRRPRGALWPAGLATAAAAVVAVGWLWAGRSALTTLPTPAAVVTDGGNVEDLDILYADEDLELIEDLEFFRWLSAGGDAG